MEIAFTTFQLQLRKDRRCMRHNVESTLSSNYSNNCWYALNIQSNLRESLSLSLFDSGLFFKMLFEYWLFWIVFNENTKPDKIA